jgi:hypothetical protein
MNSKTTKLILALVLVLSVLAPARAQEDYSFAVPTLQMHVLVNADASIKIVYDITFQANPGSHAVDVVDVGVPQKNYDLGGVTASIDGEPLGTIRPSTVVSPGFEVHLGGRQIRPGQSGTLHVEFDVPDMVYQDTTREDYASLRITPTWWDGNFLTGSGDLEIAIHLPPSVKPDEALHQGTAFTDKVVTPEGTSVVWRMPNARADGPHMVAVSFPKRDLDRVLRVSAVGLLLKWFEESPEARVIAGAFFLILFGLLFFRFTGGTGGSVFVLLSAAWVGLFCVSPGWHLVCLPAVTVAIGTNECYLRHRKMSYMPPIAQVEGGGIKRGLTAPEAAVLLELPVSKILALVVFGMLKKGILRQVQADPLVVEVQEAFHTRKAAQRMNKTRRAKFYRKAGRTRGVVVHQYEQPFIFLLENNPRKPVNEINFAVPLKGLIGKAAGRLEGFDLSDTRDYYRAIVRRALRQARAIGDVQKRDAAIDKSFEWILMDDDYPAVFNYGRGYRPIWTRGSTTVAAGTPSPAGGIPGKTSLADVSASFAGWAEHTMGNMAAAIQPGSLSFQKPGAGVIDLAGADRLTGEFFESLSQSSGGGGGGGCACACAGCACACACAGGGR